MFIDSMQCHACTKKLLLCKTRKIQLLILNFIVPRDMFEMTTVEVRLPGGCTATGLATGAFILAARCVTVEVLVTSFGIHTSVACSLTSVTPMSHIPSYSYHCVEQIHSVGTISNTKTSYPTQLSIVTGATPGIKKWLGGGTGKIGGAHSLPFPSLPLPSFPLLFDSSPSPFSLPLPSSLSLPYPASSPPFRSRSL